MGANIILDRLPDRVEIGGKEYQIFSDFRTSILFETMMRSELSDKEKLTQMLHIYYPVVPKETGEAIIKIMWFYSCGKEQQENKKNRTKQEFQRHKVSYSFEQDAPYIYAAFRKEYGINLQTIPSTDLHWWEFNALFDALPEECRIKKIMYWRTCDTAGMSKKEVQRINELRKYYELKDSLPCSAKVSLAKRNQNMKDYVQKRFQEVNRHVET